MPANYTLIEKITVGAGGASSVTFSGIPQTGYTDLVVKASVRGGGTLNLLMSINGSSSNFSYRLLEGDGSTAASYTNTTGRIGNVVNTTSNTFNNVEVYLPNYTSSTNKSYSVDAVSEANATTAYADLTAGLWSNTAAITSLGFSLSSGNIDQFSTFYLYGVAKLGTTPAIVPYATGGDIIDTDGTYWYHTFLSSGTFTPQKGLSADYLVVAGGGAGGFSAPGGGGAGGLRCTVGATGGGGSLESPLSLASGTNYTVTIGAGGAFVGSTGFGASGSNSVFATITSTGGGGGGFGGQVGLTGGSGGGGAESATTGGAGTANQGFAGGRGNGGGGGAGAVGFAGYGFGVTLANSGGIGGAGVTTSISGSSVTYASGGSAYYAAPSPTRSPNPASGGGGGASVNSGVANSGGGGAADYGSGGSGIVIVRYLV